MATASDNIVRLGTRGSLLARAQSQLVADELQRVHPGLRVELVTITTTGDRVTDRPLHELGGKGLFTKEIEQALLAGEIDFAVHSFKDVPVTMPLVDTSRLIIAATPKREDPRDVVAMRDPSSGAIQGQATVATSSLRRACQILSLAPDAKIVPVRGNIDTRLRKLREGQFDLLILAMAGLKRANLFDPAYMRALEPDTMLPAPAQGALALECRTDDDRTRRLLSVIDDPETRACVELERSVVAVLEGDCHSPIAALSQCQDDKIHLRVRVGAAGGGLPVIEAAAAAPFSCPNAALADVTQSLLDQGARKLLGHA